jgi:plastocyanin
MAVAALFVALVGAWDDGDGDESAAGSGGGATAGGAPTTITVTMHDDFTFSPSSITIPTSGATIHLVNEGAMVHNMAIPELSLTSEAVQGGGAIDWVLTDLPEGMYDFICPQAGHADAGMKGMIMVEPGATSGGSGGEPTGGEAHAGGLPGGFADWSEMDAAMLAQAQAFPAVTQGTSGANVNLEYTMDGEWKVFQLEAKIVDWEVEPGKIVEGWSYNGMIPAPTIQVSSGDHVRIVVKNSLPMSHALHFHGIQVPNLMDGVDPYTEMPAAPGETRTYEFVAKGPAVGIYHPHHGADHQIPNGMFGALLIDEMPVPQALLDKGYPLPTKSVNMVINDAGTIGLSLNGKSFPATEPYTMRVGETMLVNYFNEGLMAHPMHLHQPVGWVIAKDGITLDVPYPSDTINVAPGERYTVLYMAMEPGVWAWHCHILTHAETPAGMRYMVTAIIVEQGELSAEFIEKNPLFAPIEE